MDVPNPSQEPSSTPPLAPKPAVPAAATVPPVSSADSNKMGRRQFISWAGVAWMSFGAATTGALSIVLRFLFPNLTFEPPTTFKAGLPADYEVGIVDERWKEKFGVWLVKTAEGMYALSTICTHLGCTPNWLGGENKFKCPCHGSGFYKSGINFEGPAPRPLERYQIGLAEDGQILVDKSKKFQQEKGEWNSPDSFLYL